MSTFERIKIISNKKGINLKKLALDSGLSENAIYSWKLKTPSSASLESVAKTLNVSVDYLLGNTDNPTPVNRRFVESGLSRADKLDDVTSTGADMSDAELEKVLDYMGLLKNARKKN